MNHENFFKKTEERFLGAFEDRNVGGLGYKFITDPVAVLAYLHEHIEPEEIAHLSLAVSGLRESFTDTLSENENLNTYLSNAELSEPAVEAMCTLLKQAGYKKNEVYAWFAIAGATENFYQTPEQKLIIAIIDRTYE